MIDRDELAARVLCAIVSRGAYGAVGAASGAIAHTDALLAALASKPAVAPVEAVAAEAKPVTNDAPDAADLVTTNSRWNALANQIMRQVADDLGVSYDDSEDYAARRCAIEGAIERTVVARTPVPPVDPVREAERAVVEAAEGYYDSGRVDAGVFADAIRALRAARTAKEVS